MRTFLSLALSTASVLSAHGAEIWSSLDGTIPELKMGEASISRIDYSSGGALIANGGPSANAVQSALGTLEAGWYSGNKNNNTGTLASVTADGTTRLISASGAGGGFTAVKFHELSAGAVSRYETLRISFDTRGLSNTSRTGQPQNFSLWYSLGGEENSLLQVGSTISGLAGSVSNKSYGWTISKDEYGSLFDRGATFYLVMNTGVLDTSYAYQELAVNNFRMEGLAVPESSSAALTLLGAGGCIFGRKRRRGNRKDQYAASFKI